MEIVIKFLNLLFYSLQILIFIRVLMSWLPMDRNNGVAIFIAQVTDPLLMPAKKLMEKSIFGGKGSMLDFSPMIVLMVLMAMQNYLAGILTRL